MKTITVIGGGITGLSTMHYLQKLKNEHNLDLELILIEKNQFLGGKIHTKHHDNFVIETGADSIVARHESVMPLIKDLQIEDQLVYNSTGISYIYTNNELHAIPADTVFGIPTSVESLYESTLVSEDGKKAALKDLETKNESFTKDSSIGSFLRYFLGEELVEKQIAPVLSGVYSGELDKLSITSTLPYLLEYKNRYGSIIKGLGEHKSSFQAAANKKFLSFENGLSTLIDSLEDKVAKEAKVLKGIKTTRIMKVQEKYTIEFANHSSIDADYVVLATPHQVADDLLNDHEFRAEFDKLSNSSLISVYLGFDIPDSELPADGTGFIVSKNSDIHCNACTWTSRKWKNTSKEQRLLVRLFYKKTNPVYSRLSEMTQSEIVEVALSDIKKSVGISATPKTIEVTPWNDDMPIYGLKHGEAINSLTNKLATHYKNIHLAGCSYFGVGIGACIQNGKETAEQIIHSLK